ncbi:MAG: peptide deformylase [Firmicutes bacterium]|nr:peptide deformylase [Bacillota bacterium]
MALRRIMLYPKDNILRKRSKPVKSFDQQLNVLLNDMAETMYEADGMGLAAPQVGVLLRAVVIDTGTGLIKLVNPEILEMEGEQQDEEGCLSISEIRRMVKRPFRVKVKACDEHGEMFEMRGTSILARALCHEIDHLEGVLFIDKALPDILRKG